MDWNAINSNNIITSGLDSKCTLWDVNSQQPELQILAHDSEVFDVKFVTDSTNLFCSCGADGTVRMFDLRSLNESVILYQDKPQIFSKIGIDSNGSFLKSELGSFVSPLLRISTSSLDANFVSILALDSPDVLIIDIRSPNNTYAKLSGHQDAVSGCEWSPVADHSLTTCSVDGSVFVWDIRSQNETKTSVAQSNSFSKIHSENTISNNKTASSSNSNTIVPNFEMADTSNSVYPDKIGFSNSLEKDLATLKTKPINFPPSLTYSPKFPINAISWNKISPKWIGIAFGNTIQTLRI
ncbi:hypothetical protein BB560_000724 [Smittium megazygosporum]|uniref:Anaphase-promoting complex subunit 4 WD40 domain-containing protein n=1 Tax=Smittium megazygosporum TaxID=133381 RepID=A0A2T9ZJM2_9FUNG|nr:hypothetical protein BB560_000724 [Smittium megazygosporum]